MVFTSKEGFGNQFWTPAPKVREPHFHGPHPQYGWDFPEEILENSGKTPEFPSRVRLGSPNPHNSRHLRLPEHFQNSLPLSTAGDASFFFRNWFRGEGLSGLVMAFPAVLRAFLISSVWFAGTTVTPEIRAHANGVVLSKRRVSAF